MESQMLFKKTTARYNKHQSKCFFEDTMISLVAFLGNYGREYKGTRHNTAWNFADELPYQNAFNWQTKFKGQYASIDTSSFVDIAVRSYPDLAGKDGNPPVLPKDAPEKLYFLKPETYMNLSGESIGEIARFFKIEPAQILVVHDELELAPGFVSLKWSGGLGGHNGLRSTKAVLGTADFWRLRFGIGRPVHGDVSDYVLSAYSPDDKILMSQVFSQAGQLFTSVLLRGPDRFLPEWSKKNLAPSC